MDIETRFLEEIKFPELKKLFEISLDLLLNKNQSNNIRIMNYKSLPYEDKAKITKIYEFLNKAAYAIREKGEYGIDGLMNQLEKVQAKEKTFIIEVLKGIEFDKTLNNYKLIQKFDVEKKQNCLEQGYSDINILNTVEKFVKIEWKIEIILSSIAMKKVLKPMILMVIYTKDKRHSFYMNLIQFQEFRKNFALILKQIHQIEFRSN